MLRRCLLLSLLLFSGLPGLKLPAVAATAARPQLEASIDGLLEVLRDQSLKGAEQQAIRRARIAAVVFEQFDMLTMSKLTVGRDWKELAESERQEFVDLFKTLLEKSYVAVIDGYSDEKIEYLKEIAKGEKVEVQTRVLSQGREIPLFYRMREEGGRWLVYDVVIENVSLVRNYRSQFGPILQKKGFAGLLEQMRSKIAENARD